MNTKADQGSALRNSFKPGHIYMLVRDVDNPKPNRRQRYNWTAQPRWLAGTRFRVRRDHIFGNLWVNKISTGRWDSDGFYITKAPAELLAALVETEEATLSEELESRGLKGYESEILANLVSGGVITLEQIIKAGQATLQEAE